MQVNRLSLSLQEQLKQATNYNTQRTESLFPLVKSSQNSEQNKDFSQLDIDDLNITEDQISSLLGSFADEIVKAFGVRAPQSENQQTANKEKTGFIA